MNRRLPPAIIAAVASSLFAVPASATLLIHEPFAGYTTGDINGQFPNANSTGLNTASAWATPTSFDAVTSGLTFGNLVTSGGALQIATTGGASGGVDVLLASNFTGTLYHSHLVNVTSFGSGASGGNTLVARINTDGNTSVSSSRFRADAVSGNGTNDNVGTAYDETPVNGAGAINAGTTFLILGRFSNVGSASGTGKAEVWAMTASQFAALKSDGSITDAELDALTVPSASMHGYASETITIASAKTLLTNDAIQFAAQGDTSAITARIDEVRYGQSFDDVTPIPEPASAGLVAAGAIGLLARRRRRDSVSA